MTTTLLTGEADLELASSSPGYWHRVWGRVRRDPVALVTMLIIAAIVGAAIFAPWIAPYDPYKGVILDRLKPPGTPGHWLGTDDIGRDLLSRMIFGGRLSLFAGMAPVFAALVIGGGLGLVAGFMGGRINSLIMRVMDVLLAFPSVLLAVAICGALGTGIGNNVLALTIVFVPAITRVAESVATQVRSNDFVDAARAAGGGTLSIMFTHVVPNVLAPVVVFATSLVSISLILASGLSFLGLGAVPPQAEWGLMLNSLRPMLYIDPMIAVMPGVMIFALSMSFNLLSDALRGAMDVRL
jgi:peptide/nickel transport system permease protein